MGDERIIAGAGVRIAATEARANQFITLHKMSNSTPPPEKKTIETSNSGGKPQLKFSKHLSDTVNQSIRWIIKDLFAEGEQMLVFGPPKVGKSQFALQMALAVAVGKKFLIWDSGDEKGMKVLYVNLEIGERSFMRRVAKHVWNDVHTSDSEPPADDESIPIESVTLINNHLGERFYFSENLRSVNITIDHLSGNADSEDEPVKSAEISGKELEMLPGMSLNKIKALAQKMSIEWSDKWWKGMEEELLKKLLAKELAKELAKDMLEDLVKKWHDMIDEHEPELIIFDTLSKMHAIDERENSAIQRVLMLIRKIATIKSNETGEDHEKTGEVRRGLAHVIVHHSRKQSDDDTTLKPISLDAIRGGSAIRAEADVIIGINGFIHPKDNTSVRRIIGIEARNIAGDEFTTEFDGCDFEWVKPESDTSKGNTILKCFKTAEDNDLAGVPGIPGVRGIPIGLLRVMYSHYQDQNEENRKHEKKKAKRYKNKTKKEQERDHKESEETIKEFAASNPNILTYIYKNGNEKLIANSPVHARKLNGKGFYWIPEGSPWLNEDPIRTRIAAMSANSAATPDATPSLVKAKRKQNGRPDGQVRGHKPSSESSNAATGKQAAKKAPVKGPKGTAKKAHGRVVTKETAQAPKKTDKKEPLVPKRSTNRVPVKSSRKPANNTPGKTAKKVARKVGRNADRKRL